MPATAIALGLGLYRGPGGGGVSGGPFTAGFWADATTWDDSTTWTD